MVRGVVGKLIVALMVSVSACPGVFAAEKKAPSKPVQLIHTPPDPRNPKQFPAPGEIMTLGVTLKNTKDSERKLRAFIVRDGQMLDITVPSGIYNQDEDPYYEVPMYAPEGELFYVFMLYNPDGTITSSERYFMRRTCLPDITPASGVVDKSAPPEAQLIDLVYQNERLNRDMKSYQTVLTLLKELQKLIGEK